MTKSKARGTAAETSVVRYLQANGFPRADRSPLRGGKDTGDVTGVELDNQQVVLEVKNCKAMALAQWVDELIAEMDNAGSSVGAVVHKRVRKGDPGEWYATLPFDVLVRLLLR